MLTGVVKMDRFFYPVGQGAFYREKFILNNNEVFNVIYDCGTMTTHQGNKNIVDVIDNWDTQRVDILFISHFHQDHISKLSYLIKKTHPKLVVMPFLTDLEKYYFEIGLLYSNLDKQIADIDFRRIMESMDFIDNPYRYLQKNEIKEVLFIAKEKNIENKNDNLIVVPEGDLFTQKDKIKLFESYDKFWVFDTFVSPQFNRKSVVDNFNKNVCNIKEIICNPDKVREILSSNDYKNKIKKIYGKNINEMSMTLYSGPTNNDVFYQQATKRNVCKCFYTKNAGCLYTGDYNANKKDLYDDLMNHFSIYNNKIGCLQLPHHGSNDNFNDGFLKLDCFYIACVGENNKYGHPGNIVVNKIMKNNKPLFIVTENTSELLLKVRKVSNCKCQ